MTSTLHQPRPRFGSGRQHLGITRGRRHPRRHPLEPGRGPGDEHHPCAGYHHKCARRKIEAHGHRRCNQATSHIRTHAQHDERIRPGARKVAKKTHQRRRSCAGRCHTDAARRAFAATSRCAPAGSDQRQWQPAARLHQCTADQPRWAGATLHRTAKHPTPPQRRFECNRWRSLAQPANA